MCVLVIEIFTNELNIGFPQQPCVKKRQSMEWKHSDSSVNRKFGMQWSIMKVTSRTNALETGMNLLSPKYWLNSVIAVFSSSLVAALNNTRRLICH